MCSCMLALKLQHACMLALRQLHPHEIARRGEGLLRLNL